MSCRKGLRIFAITLLSISLAACTQTTSKMSKAERRKVEAQNRAVGQLIAGAIVVGAAVVIGASASRGHTYYGGNYRYRAHQRYHRHRPGGCVNYGTPTPYSGMCGY